jgi:hypothetical protein
MDYANAAAHLLRIPISRYIISNRHRLAAIAKPIPPNSTARLREYFEPADLDRVRVVQRDPLPVTDPPFSAFVRHLGFDYPGISASEGITFDHIIAVRTWNDRLLFHELVHVVQYRLLGVETFTHLYIRGFLSKGSYDRIPLEVCAYELDRRLDRGGAPFRVQSEVKRWISSGRF